MLTATSRDGTEVRAYDDGQGPAILVLHGGLDDGSAWANVAAGLAERFRVVRIHRRRYRTDLPSPEKPIEIADEVDDVLAISQAIRQPIALVGHSSGGVVALETLLAGTTATFTGAVLYEPPVLIDAPLGGEDGERALARARTAIAEERVGRAMTVFFRDIVGMAPAVARVAGGLVALDPRKRRLAPCQIDDWCAIDRLGVRLDAYAGIVQPILLLGGGRSPAHLGRRLQALARVLPHQETVVMASHGHDVNQRAAAECARVIESFLTRGRGTPSA